MDRHNFYIDEERMEMLRRLARAEGDVSVSELVREAIDLVIADRMNNPRPSLEQRREKFDAFISKYAGSTQDRSAERDEALIDEVDAEQKQRRYGRQPA